MLLHLNYDSKQSNGIIFNDLYQTGALFNNRKPNLSFEYDEFSYSEVFDGENKITIGGTQRVMSADEEIEIKGVATSWKQELGEEGNPSPAQLQERENKRHEQYLKDTDWFVIRLQETGIVIPVEISSARASARASIKV